MTQWTQKSTRNFNSRIPKILPMKKGFNKLSKKLNA